MSAAGRVIGTAALLLPLTGCVMPSALRAVKTARDGVPLGGRVCVVYSQRYQIDLGGLERLHSFDIHKYEHIYLRLVADGVLRPEDVFVPPPITRDELLRVQSAAYLDRLRTSVVLARCLEANSVALLPSCLASAAIARPFRYATGGTLLAARLALAHGMAINLGGGYHHAAPDAGGGFCVYADMPVAIRALQAEGKIARALVVDLDVHQGNGTALCVANDDNVFTFDMHEEDIYPIPKAHNDLDVPLAPRTGDSEYLTILARYLPEVFDRARPDLVFFQAGVDCLADDPLANLALTPDGIVQRDALVFAEAARCHVPIVMVLGGGYSKSAWEVQYRSIHGLIERYGQADRRADSAPATAPAPP